MDIEKLIEQLNARGLSNGSSLGYHSGLFDEAAAALATLRAENEKLRGELEQVWSGCDFCNTADFGEFGFEITKHYAKICCALGSWRFPEKEQFLFCPKCGKPLTDEAVEMVMERWKEALGDET